jgi:hypothetical protein
VSLIRQSIEKTDQRDSVRLPEGLRRQFAELERRLWRVETLAAVCLGLSGLAGSLLALFISDRIGDTPPWLRGLISLAGLAVLALAVVAWSRNWIWQRRDQRALANLVQKQFRKLGDRLLGIVELANEAQRPAYFSPALYEAAINQVAAEARGYNFREAVAVQPVHTRGTALLALLAVILAAAVAVPAAFWNSLLRWAAPLSATPRFTLVALDDFPAEQVVPHGETFVVAGQVQYRSFWKPQRAVGQFEAQSRLESRVNEQHVEFKVPSQTRDGRFTVRVGDARKQIIVRPTHRPSLKELAASIQLPEYLRYPVVTQAVQNGAVTLIEGSLASFVGKTTRELASAELKLEAQQRQTLQIEGETFVTDAIGSQGVLEFTWQDRLGLRSEAPWRLTVETQKDLPPVAELLDMPREISMLESEVLELKAQGRDDFGVRDLGVEWVMEGEWAPTNGVPKTAVKVDAETARETKLTENFGFSPTLLKIPPDSAVELKLFTRDFFPNRESVESAVYRIHVLGNEKHAEMVRQQLESLQAQLEEVTRLEEKIADGTRELKELSAQELADEKQNERIGALKEDQARNAANLEQLSLEGSKTLREAMRNPLVPEETLRDWTKTLQQMQQLSRGEMKQATDSLKSAQKSPPSRPQEMANALQKEEEALEALEQMQQKVNKELDQLQALTLAQRLRKLGVEEKEIETRLQKNIGETIGLTPRELPERYQRANAAFADNQKSAHTEAQTLQGEISRFFERTQQADYGLVNKEMAEARTTEELEKVKSFIQDNISMEAMQHLAAWSERFASWAEKLEPKQKGGGEGGGSGESSQSDLAEKLMKTLLGLLRLRETETNLREQTRLVEQRKEEGPIYLYNADLLTGKERESMRDLFRVQKNNPLAMLQPVFGDTFGSMKTVEGLLSKPETGVETRNAERKTIELLSDGINLINEQVQQGSQSSASSSASEEIAFLMQMMAQTRAQQMGMDKGKSGGGSQAGGSTDRRPDSASADASGKASERRNTPKATGFSGNVPTEFRDALENYFKALEKEGE